MMMMKMSKVGCNLCQDFIYLVLYFKDLLFVPQDITGGQKLADEAASFYERATSTLLKKNLLLYFAYADFEEVCQILVVFMSCFIIHIFVHISI